jgi:hypothetical protein
MLFRSQTLNSMGVVWAVLGMLKPLSNTFQTQLISCRIYTWIPTLILGLCRA